MNKVHNKTTKTAKMQSNVEARIARQTNGALLKTNNQPPNFSNISGVTLVALVITIMFFYDKLKKCSNNNSFLLYSI